MESLRCAQRDFFLSQEFFTHGSPIFEMLLPRDAFKKKKERKQKNEKEKKKRIGCKNTESGSEEMNQWLTPHYFAEDLSPVPSTHIVTAFNSSSRGVQHPLLASMSTARIQSIHIHAGNTVVHRIFLITIKKNS